AILSVGSTEASTVKRRDFIALVGGAVAAGRTDTAHRGALGCRFAHPCCASFVFDLQMCNRHDLKSCGATLFAAVWLRERAHVRKNAA
ncbi:MAG: hypothetical protein WCE32_18980, partial [Pseudolabrys sp.]